MPRAFELCGRIICPAAGIEERLWKESVYMVSAKGHTMGDSAIIAEAGGFSSCSTEA